MILLISNLLTSAMMILFIAVMHSSTFQLQTKPNVLLGSGWNIQGSPLVFKLD